MTSAPSEPNDGEQLKPISMKVGKKDAAPYKSIDYVEWDNISPFAVLTGPNGSGKSQLLQILAYKLSNLPNLRNLGLHEFPFEIFGDTIGPHEIAYLPTAENAIRVDGSHISNLHQLKRNFLQRLGPQNVVNDIAAQILRERVQQKYGIAISQQPTEEDLAKLPDDFLYMLDYAEVSASLSHVFVAYQLRLAEKLLSKKTEEQAIKELGRPPWEFVNEALKSAEFKYRITPPSNNLMKDRAGPENLHSSLSGIAA